MAGSLMKYVSGSHFLFCHRINKEPDKNIPTFRILLIIKCAQINTIHQRNDSVEREKKIKSFDFRRFRWMWTSAQKKNTQP